ncbi:MAG: DUF2007 domain-containing protein [Firmicutes bacterium]|jgi:hypothetical protein|nr:DUF2007 domain-containing protein [Bacillota bacterium]
MWTVIYVARDRTEAEMLKNILDQEGMLVMLRTIGVPHLGNARSVEILVPSSEAEEANEILQGNLCF